MKKIYAQKVKISIEVQKEILALYIALYSTLK